MEVRLSLYLAGADTFLRILEAGGNHGEEEQIEDEIGQIEKEIGRKEDEKGVRVTGIGWRRTNAPAVQRWTARERRGTRRLIDKTQ